MARRTRNQKKAQRKQRRKTRRNMRRTDGGGFFGNMKNMLQGKPKLEDGIYDQKSLKKIVFSGNVHEDFLKLKNAVVYVNNKQEYKTSIKLAWGNSDENDANTTPGEYYDDVYPELQWWMYQPLPSTISGVFGNKTNKEADSKLKDFINLVYGKENIYSIYLDFQEKKKDDIPFDEIIAINGEYYFTPGSVRVKTSDTFNRNTLIMYIEDFKHDIKDDKPIITQETLDSLLKFKKNILNYYAKMNGQIIDAYDTTKETAPAGNVSSDTAPSANAL